MSDDDLFSNEQAALAAAEARLADADCSDDETRDAFAGMVKEFRKLLRTTRRMIRLSDRNERKLATLAEQQRQAAEEISRKNQELETLSGKLAKYLSPQVYGSIFSGQQEVKLASRREKLSVFFSDIEGFTKMTDRMESEDLTQLLNHYLTEMAMIATEYGATIDKFVGDAIMIFFGDPETRGVREDALACVKMAIAMQARLDELRREWQRAGIREPMRCRVGINTGYCTVGNFGSEDRMDYTIIGGAVNIASRLEHEAEPGEIFISYETWAHVREEIACEEVGAVQLQGVAYPIDVYRVIGAADNALRSRLVHADKPNFKLFIDLDRMCADEREENLMVLREAIAAIGTSKL